MKHIKAFSVVILFFSFCIIYAQKKDINDDIRSNALVSIPEILIYPDSAIIDSFVIGLTCRDSSLYKNLNTVIGENSIIQNKPVKIKLFNKEKDIRFSHVLYVSPEDSFDLDLIYDKIKDQPTLLITENYPYYKSMLNYNTDSATWELNLHRAEKSGIIFTNELVEKLSLDKKTNWMELYENIHSELVDEKKDLIIKREEIKQKEAELLEKNKELELKKKEIIIKNQEILFQKKLLDSLMQNVAIKQKELVLKTKEINQKELEIAQKQKAIENLNSDISVKQKNLEDQTKKLEEQKAQINEQFEEIRKQETIILLFIILIAFVLIAIIAMIRAFIIKKKANKALSEKNEIIEKQYNITKEQKAKIEVQNNNIMDSINYAQKIQTAILPDLKEIENTLKNVFVIYKPKDIVSGDFFWQSKIGEKIIIVAGDCTGHGVPGAFMSMLGITFLNSIVNQNKITDPAEILNKLRQNIINSLKQHNETGNLKDGMDIAVCCIDSKKSNITFSGANNPMILIRGNDIEVFKGDKMPVAIYEKMISFSNKDYKLKPDDSIYVFSDGIIDQFGGDKGKKFMIKRLKELLLKINQLPMNEQKKIILNEFEKWKGDEEQVDDIVMIGLKIESEVIN